MQTKILTALLSLFDTTTQLEGLYKETFGDILVDYTYTEMHCIDCIGKIENPNVTKIALAMNLTKAAISKSIKKLIKKEAIEVYKAPENKKEIYYKLTETGQEVFNKHLSMHKNWCTKDEEFFKQFKADDLERFYNILSKYTKTLQIRLENLKEDLK